MKDKNINLNKFEEIYNEDVIEISELNSEIQELMLAKEKIKNEVEKLKEYIKSSKKEKFLFNKYVDVDEFRELEIENKSQAQANIDEMNQLVQNIKETLSVKEERASNLWQEIYKVTTLKSREKNRLKNEIDNRYYEGLNLNQEKDNNDLQNGIDNETIRYEDVKKLIEKLPIDITEEVDQKKKSGNQKWKFTEGMILNKIEKNFSTKLTKKQKNVVIKYIQKYRVEVLNK